ncbi:hypothetical protein [Hominenteromicrobium sp.]|uniref:hypothetical protein n=1 Tax=Hominenteromicrobium sp. TaxID=3073581 RepID=UPI00399AD042
MIVQENGRVTILDRNGKKLLQEFVRDRTVRGTDFSALMISAREFMPNPGGGYALKVRFESDPEEKIYGMGQYQQETFNLKGAVLELAQRNAQVSVPFYVSSLGYGFLWNNPAIGEVTFSTNKTQWTACSTEQMDYWVTAGDTPEEIMAQYARATGFPSEMPDFATGFWQCKCRYQTQEELLSQRGRINAAGCRFLLSSSTFSTGRIRACGTLTKRIGPTRRVWRMNCARWALSCLYPYGRR